MKQKIETKRNKKMSRMVAVAAVIGLALSAIFASAASAIMDTDPVIEAEGTCHLFGAETPSGVWISITNNDSWDEDYVIGVFEGLHEDGEMPDEMVEITVESGETVSGPLFVDSAISTIQIIDLSGAAEGVMVYDEVVLVCLPPMPDFDFGDDEEEEEEDRRRQRRWSCL